MESKEFSFHLDNFEGPLDLLLSLVKDKKIDILDVDLAVIATEYLSLIDKIKDKDIDVAGEYLVMAASLIQLKAKILLQYPNQEEEIKEEKEVLLSQLIEYQQFKNLSGKLRENEQIRKNFFIKEADEYDDYQYPEDETRLDGSSDAIKLIMSLRKMFERLNAQKLRETTIEKFNLSPADRRLELLEIFRVNDKPAFDQIFSVPTMNHFVVTLLTVLDMARKQEIKMKQDEQYGTIEFLKGHING